MTELDATLAWVQAKHHLRAGSHAPDPLAPSRSRRRSERGASAVEWLLIIIAAVGICAAVALAVTTYVNTQSGKLNG